MADIRIKRITQRGFTLIEVLFSLSICLLIVLNSVPILRIISAKDKLKSNPANYAIGAKQLSWILYTAKDIQTGDRLSFKNNKDELFTISLNNHRVVKEPGFDIIIRDVDEVSFYQQEKKIYMKITGENHDYTYLIGTDYQVWETKDENNETSLE